MEHKTHSNRNACHCFPSTPGVSLIHIIIFPAGPSPHILPGLTHHCVCMPNSELTCWLLPDTLTFLDPSSCFSFTSPNLCSPPSWESMLISALRFAVFCGGTLPPLCNPIGFLSEPVGLRGSGLPLWAHTDRFDDRGWMSTAAEERKTNRGLRKSE